MRYEYNSENFTWIDLGLPSGRLWAKENIDRFFTFDEAVKTFGDDLPSKAAWKELKRKCVWKWNENTLGYDIIGPNGNSIFLPASGYRSYVSGAVNFVGGRGYWWSSSPSSVGNAYFLSFYSSYVYPLSTYSRASGFCVRPCKY